MVKTYFIYPEIKSTREVGVGDILEISGKILVTDELKDKGSVRVTIDIEPLPNDNSCEFTEDFIRRNIKKIVERSVDIC